MFTTFNISRKMFRGFLSFIVGIYAGIYLTQNYDIPKVDDPAALYNNLREYAESHKKK